MPENLKLITGTEDRFFVVFYFTTLQSLATKTLFICCLCVFAFFAVFHVRMCSSTFDVSVFVPFIFELFRFSQRFLVNCLFYFFITLPLAFEAFSKLEEFASDFLICFMNLVH